MKLLFLFWVLPCIYAASFQPVYQANKLQHSGWQKTSKAESGIQVLVKLALVQQNVGKAEEELLRVSDPTSPHFAKHWNRSQVNSWFKPHSSSVVEVLSWLQKTGIHPSRTRLSNSGGWLLFNSTVLEVEQVFQTTYHLHKRKFNEGLRISYDKYAISSSLHQHIDFISTTAFLDISNRSHARERNSLTSHTFTDEVLRDQNVSLSCNKYITPNCLRSLYRMPGFDEINVHPASTLGIFEITMASWLPNDLDLFFERFAPSLVGMRPRIETINGGEYQTEAQNLLVNSEANLDFEYTMALTARPGINLQVGNKPLAADMDSMLAALDGPYCDVLQIPFNGRNESIHANHNDYNQTVNCGTVKPLPAVIAVPYLWDETEFSEATMKRQCLEFLKLGLQGVTVIVASGDHGAAGRESSCPDNRRVSPASPAVCPYVTSVGATQLEINSTQAFQEVAIFRKTNTSILSSGGGFSSYFKAPSYQNDFVNKYIREDGHNHRNNSLYYDTRGRGIPDIAANGRNYVFTVNGKFMTIHGTSAAVPTIASLVTLLNDARLHAGKSTVGFMNPVLYANSDAVKDITFGSNYMCQEQVFKATKGWDPVTGLGTPDFQQLSKIYSLLP